MRERIQKAVLHSAVEPTEAQKKRFEAFLRKKYGQAVLLQWEQDAALENGFRLEVGADLYDWSLEGRLRQFREQLEQLKPVGMSVIPLMREAVRNWQPEVTPEDRHRQRAGKCGLRRDFAVCFRRHGHGAGSSP